MRAALLGFIPAVLSFEERRWLRAFLDFTAREQIAERIPSAPHCRGCARGCASAHPAARIAPSATGFRRRRNRQLAAERRLPSGRSRSARPRWASGDDATG
jgi:hypothetical protein